MDVIKHYPTGQLARYVESMWYSRVEVSQHLLLLPAGKVQVVIPLAGDGTPSHAQVQLQHTVPVARTLEPSRSLGVTFHAHGLRAFCADALDDLGTAPGLQLRDLWRRQEDHWQEPLRRAKTVAEKFRVLESALWRALRPQRPQAERIEHAIGLLADPFAPRTVPDVAKEVGMASRQFLQVFREDTGLTPKMYARVMRFRAAARLMRHRDSARWTETAALCNYFDQAHLVRDFRDFAGMTPTAYLQVPGLHAACLTWRPPEAGIGVHQQEVDAELVT